METQAPAQRTLFRTDVDLAAEYWADKEWKKFAVDIKKGNHKKLTYQHTTYVRARTGADAIEWVKSNLGLFLAPGRCWFAARLAGPRELGCDIR